MKTDDEMRERVKNKYLKLELFLIVKHLKKNKTDKSKLKI